MNLRWIAVLVSAIVFVLAFGSMIAAGMPLLTAIRGVAIGGAVAIAVLVAVTFVPALLGFAPLSKRRQRKADKRAVRQKPSLGTRWARFVVRRPLVVLLFGVVGLGAIAVQPHHPQDLLSVSAGLGAVVAIFQWGWLGDLFEVEQPGAIVSTLPTFMIGVVFGFAMDYVRPVRPVGVVAAPPARPDPAERGRRGREARTSRPGRVDATAS
ncbi:MMPL family transporter [Streptomyces erythrochromogenes]|uniref:MMPL family transporter n=1 Tax=Streptomyces erythrochromogenes TaxID=285574 RepID=UPI00368F0894